MLLSMLPMQETPHHIHSPLGTPKHVKKSLSVAIGLIVQGDKVLIGKRTSGYYTGFWEYPGGKIEANEAPYDALVREMNEELGIIVTEATEVLHIQENHPHTSVHLQVWHIHAYTNQIIANEQQELQWCSISRLDHTQVIPTNAPITEFLSQLIAE